MSLSSVVFGLSTLAVGGVLVMSNARMRLQVENDRLLQELSLLKEELRIKDPRMRRIDPHRRPH